MATIHKTQGAEMTGIYNSHSIGNIPSAYGTYDNMATIHKYQGAEMTGIYNSHNIGNIPSAYGTYCNMHSAYGPYCNMHSAYGPYGNIPYDKRERHRYGMASQNTIHSTIHSMDQVPSSESKVENCPDSKVVVNSGLVYHDTDSIIFNNFIDHDTDDDTDDEYDYEDLPPLVPTSSSEEEVVTASKCLTTLTSELQTELEAIDSHTECYICFDNKINPIHKRKFEPCGHTDMCDTCLDKILKMTKTTHLSCPFCRQNVEKIVTQHYT